MSELLIHPADERRPIGGDHALLVRRCPPEEISRWDQFVVQAPAGTIYHSSVWSSVLAQCYGFRPIMLALESEDGDIRGILPLHLVASRLTGRRLVSLPCTNAAGPLCLPGVDPSPLIDAATRLTHDHACRYLELRGQPAREPTDIAGLQTLRYYGTFLLDLQPSGAGVQDRFDRRAKRGIARASRSHVQVRFADDASAVRQYCRLNALTRRKHGVPPQPHRFFETLWAQLRPRGAVEILMAEYDGQVVAAIVLLAYRETVSYAYGASDQSYLRFAPNHALFDTAIAWAAERGYSYFDFGRTAPDNQGLMEFKHQWGAEFLPLPYYYWPARGGFVAESAAGLKHRLFASVWRRLPLALTTLVGPRLYRHLA